MKRRILLCSTLAAALLLIALGILQGQSASVMAKAVRICMECVGIG